MAVHRPAATTRRDESEERLLVEAAQKNPAKFVDLYEVHFERVYAFIARRVRDRETAEDLTSEVFHKALANLANYEWRGAPFVAWLIRIAANAVADETKRSTREPSSNPGPAVEPGVAPDFEAIEYRALLFRLVDQLPSNQRQVIFGRFVDEKSVREIARQLGRTEGAVKQLQFRALQTLRAQMEGGRA
jgi:RNA polymerase sigma-70 factor, ECF subfamily